MQEPLTVVLVCILNPVSSSLWSVQERDTVDPDKLPLKFVGGRGGMFVFEHSASLSKLPPLVIILNFDGDNLVNAKLVGTFRIFDVTYFKLVSDYYRALYLYIRMAR